MLNITPNHIVNTYNWQSVNKGKIAEKIPTQFFFQVFLIYVGTSIY